MTEELRTSLVLSKIFLTATMELIKFDLRKSLCAPVNFEEVLKDLVGDSTAEASLKNNLGIPYRAGLSIDRSALSEFDQIAHDYRNKIFHLVDDLLVFELNFDLTEEEYPLTRVFPPNKAVTDGERGEVFNEAFYNAYSSMFQRMKSKKKPAEEVIEFLEAVRIKNPSFIKYLGFMDSEITYDKVKKLLTRIESRT